VECGRPFCIIVQIETVAEEINIGRKLGFDEPENDVWELLNWHSEEWTAVISYS
jgi:hypothetical protein